MASNVKPINPNDDLIKLKFALIPDAVFEVLNMLIAKKWDGHSAYVLQKEVVAALKEKGFAESEIYDGHWLDFEDSYRAEGWKVVYDRPGYNESYDASFKFSK